jgi:SlyX protein
MDQQDMEARFEKIETKLLYIEDFLARLQDETAERGVFMDKLKTEHSAMKSRLLQISRDLEEIPNKKPPHY